MEYLEYKQPYIKRDTDHAVGDWQNIQPCIDVFNAIMKTDNPRIKFVTPTFSLYYVDGVIKLHRQSKRIIAIVDKKKKEITLAFRTGVADEAKVRHLVRKYFTQKRFKFYLVGYEDIWNIHKHKMEMGIYDTTKKEFSAVHMKKTNTKE